MDAARSFSEFRQEASMLHSLQHPCIVALVGISIHPLCFALQLAPLGSLNTILEERAKGLAHENHLFWFLHKAVSQTNTKKACHIVQAKYKC